jgi:hypothetical protein
VVCDRLQYHVADCAAGFHLSCGFVSFGAHRCIEPVHLDRALHWAVAALVTRAICAVSCGMVEASAAGSSFIGWRDRVADERRGPLLSPLPPPSPSPPPPSPTPMPLRSPPRRHHRTPLPPPSPSPPPPSPTRLAGAATLAAAALAATALAHPACVDTAPRTRRAHRSAVGPHCAAGERGRSPTRRAASRGAGRSRPRPVLRLPSR